MNEKKFEHYCRYDFNTGDDQIVGPEYPWVQDVAHLLRGGKVVTLVRDPEETDCEGFVDVYVEKTDE